MVAKHSKFFVTYYENTSLTNLILHIFQLPEDTQTIDITARGQGVSLVQVTYKYNVKVTAPKPAFFLDPQLDRTTDTNKLRLVACTGSVILILTIYVLLKLI